MQSTTCQLSSSDAKSEWFVLYANEILHKVDFAGRPTSHNTVHDIMKFDHFFYRMFVIFRVQP